MTTTAKTILILAIVLGAGAGAYFLLKPKVSSASVHAREGGSAGAGDNALAEYSSTTDNTPATTDNTPATSAPNQPSITPFNITPYGDEVPFTADLTPYGSVWGDIPWELLTPSQQQDIINYYKEHPDIVNPYYDYCHVGKPPKQQTYAPYSYQKLEYHRLGYTLRMGESSSDMITLPFDKTTKSLPHQEGIIYVANGTYAVKWGLDMTAVDDGIEWKLEIQDNVVKSGKFLFKNIEFGKVDADSGPAIIGGALSTEKVWWTLSLWVDV